MAVRYCPVDSGRAAVSIIFRRARLKRKNARCNRNPAGSRLSHFEVVAVNDRSTDQTPAILHDLQKTAQKSDSHGYFLAAAGWLATARAGAGYEIAWRVAGVH